MKERTYTVKKVAELKEITIKRLHHYDDKNLLKPDNRSAAGYRLYSHDNLESLDKILFYRELGFSLEAIALLLQGTLDRTSMLKKQLLLLDTRQHDTDKQINNIMNAIAISEDSAPYTPWACDRHDDICLFTNKDILKGELVYSRVTPRLILDIEQEQYNTLNLKQATENYVLENSYWNEFEETYHLDCDALPFIRRSNKPNLVQDPDRDDIYLIARQGIKSGSELTR